MYDDHAEGSDMGAPIAVSVPVLVEEGNIVRVMVPYVSIVQKDLS